MSPPTPATSPARYGGATITEHRLRNGLRVLIAERHSDPVVAAMLYYQVGSRDERPEEAGLSHFLEHMMFKGTPRRGKGEVDRITTQLGGGNNAFTTSDHTAYWFELASDRWEEALAIEADRMRNLLLDPKEFAAEKAVVLEELSMGQDDPWRRLSTAVQEVLFGRHPYARPVIGYQDVLEHLGPEDMRDYYERFYRPSNATLVLCGDLRASRALKLVREHFGGLSVPASNGHGGVFRPAPTEPLGERRIATTWDDPVARLVMAWPSAAVGTDEDFVLDLISTLLSGGRLSRLHRVLVLERGLATSASTSNDARSECGAFWLYAEAVCGVAPADLEQAVDRELERLASEPLPAAELARAKAILAAGEAYGCETVSDLAEHLGGYAVDADWPLVLELTKRRNAVRAADVRRLARDLLHSRRRVVGWSLSAETTEGGQK